MIDSPTIEEALEMIKPVIARQKKAYRELPRSEKIILIEEKYGRDGL